MTASNFWAKFNVPRRIIEFYRVSRPVWQSPLNVWNKKQPLGVSRQDIQNHVARIVRRADVPEWNYRRDWELFGIETFWEIFLVRFVMSAFWCWTFYHLYREWPKLIVEFYIPEHTAFSDKELGIPPEGSPVASHSRVRI